jgi:hypothetical protein
LCGPSWDCPWVIWAGFVFSCCVIVGSSH